MQRSRKPLITIPPYFALAQAILVALMIPSCKPKPDGGLKPGKKAPEIRADGWINGKPPTDLRGKVLVVDGWATWCGPCIDSFPGLIRLYNRYRSRGVVFIGLTAEGDDQTDRIREVVAKHEIPWHIGYGAGSTLEDFELVAYPSIWVIGRDGTILWNRDSGEEESITDALDRALAAEVQSESR